MVEQLNPQKYKLVVDETSGNKWVKELLHPGTDSKDCMRHHV